jgi:hypothetical protein
LVFIRFVTVRRSPHINRTRRQHQSEKCLAKPMPTGFPRQMPIKPRVNFLAEAFCVKFSRITRGIHAFLANSHCKKSKGPRDPARDGFRLAKTASATGTKNKSAVILTVQQGMFLFAAARHRHIPGCA